ncbi:MAG: DUF2141 domain-containing protein [Pseudomonadota bacterium]
MSSKLILLAMCPMLFVLPSHADSLKITVTNVAQTSGNIMLQLVSSEGEFKGEGTPVAQLQQRAVAGAMSFHFDNLATGEYAFRISHDVNGNQTVDTNMMGIPTEPWAFSNNASGTFGPPKWKRARFMVDGEVVQTIELNR